MAVAALQILLPIVDVRWVALPRAVLYVAVLRGVLHQVAPRTMGHKFQNAAFGALRCSRV